MFSRLGGSCNELDHCYAVLDARTIPGSTDAILKGLIWDIYVSSNLFDLIKKKAVNVTAETIFERRKIWFMRIVELQIWIWEKDRDSRFQISSMLWELLQSQRYNWHEWPVSGSICGRLSVYIYCISMILEVDKALKLAQSEIQYHRNWTWYFAVERVKVCLYSPCPILVLSPHCGLCNAVTLVD